MKLELVSHPVCPYVHRAAIVLFEKGVAFDKRYVDLKNKPDWLLALSPRGKVPVLVADGTALFESAAICEFLDETHPPRLMPEDPFKRALERAWVEVANDLLAAQYKAFTAPESEYEAANKAMTPTLARFEDALDKGVLSAQAFGLAHVAVAPALHRFVVVSDRLGTPLLSGTPRVGAWARAVAARPSVTETVPTNFSDLFVKAMTERGSHLLRSLA